MQSKAWDWEKTSRITGSSPVWRAPISRNAGRGKASCAFWIWAAALVGTRFIWLKKALR